MIANTIEIGDCRQTMQRWIAAGVKVQCVVTSPPYWGLRDYRTGKWQGGDPECDHRSPTMRDGRNEERAKLAGSEATNNAQLLLAHNSACGKCGAVKVDQQLGLEKTPAQYLANMVGVFEFVRSLLARDGTLWLNMGDSYATSGTRMGDGGPAMLGRAVSAERSLGYKLLPKGWKAKDMIGMPWRLAFALQDAGWYLRQDIIWAKPNPMPESTRDRCTKSHEYLFLLSKSRRYYYHADAIAEPVSPDTHMRAARGCSDDHKWADGGPGDHTLAKIPPNGGHAIALEERKPGVNPKAKPVVGWAIGNGDHKSRSFNQEGEHPKAGGPRNRQNESFSAAISGGELLVRNKRSVWTIPTQPFSGAHFATFPEALVEPCILAGSRPDDIVLDPFMGSGTVARVAVRLGRRYLGCELNGGYSAMQEDRVTTTAALVF